ncbi:heme-binding protein [uncultured Erythrobacter sp.]|uniref:SOUL family heme-binding protein n=1 Tax=uncultured Erythrobacter sp. TaxID=263913 RepID=UPI00260A08F3|nr:heme-binding protein [uncultured Erythrobacter sp.]
MGIGKWVAAGAGLVAAGGAVAYAQYRDIEKPAYEVVMADEAFELRQYGTMIVAEVTHTGSRRGTSGKSFRRLAAYIFGDDRPDGGEPIAMTSPVISERVNQNEAIAMTSPVMSEELGDGEWRMRFVMPSKYTMETLPTPPSAVTLTEVPGRRMAAVQFSGNAPEGDLAEMEAQLNNWVEDQGLTPVGSIEYAFYDAPMVPGPLRRNEVMVEVAAQ